MPKPTIASALAKRIKLVGLDVDGVLTDGGLYIGMIDGRSVELKRFHIQDGMGSVLLRAAGIAVALVSGRSSEATLIRARELEVDALIQDPDGRGRKLAPFEELLERRGLDWGDCAFVGDDLADIPLLRRVALPVAVANAVPDVRAAARVVTKVSGGQGAVREVAELLLKARGEWAGVLAQYFEQREERDVARRTRRTG